LPILAEGTDEDGDLLEQMEIALPPDGGESKAFLYGYVL
jgi:hypothetical protein